MDYKADTASTEAVSLCKRGQELEQSHITEDSASPSIPFDRSAAGTYWEEIRDNLFRSASIAAGSPPREA